MNALQSPSVDVLLTLAGMKSHQSYSIMPTPSHTPPRARLSHQLLTSLYIHLVVDQSHSPHSQVHSLDISNYIYTWAHVFYPSRACFTDEQQTGIAPDENIVIKLISTKVL